MLDLYKKQFKRKKPAVRYPEGIGKREICTNTSDGGSEYKRRREELEIRQNFKCAICKRCFLVMTFDHEAGRGGGKRDDRILNEKGEWQNAALCLECNGFKGSRRYRWINGEYLPVTKFKEKAA